MTTKQLAQTSDTMPATAGEDSQTVALMQLAIQSGNLEMFRELNAVRESERADWRRRQFTAALAAAQAEMPPVPRRKGIPDANGRIKYRYAPIEQVVEHATPYLSKRGLSHGFSVAYMDNHEVEVTCILRHVDGHEQPSPVRMPGVQVPKANAAQNEGARITYAKRLAYLNATGIVTADEDTDARDMHPPTDIVTEEQAATLQALAEEVGMDAEATQKFLALAGVDTWAGFPAAHYRAAVGRLERKRKEAAA